MKKDCRRQWEHVLSSLKPVEGLIIEPDRIGFPRMLDDQSRDVIAHLIADLVDANCLAPACTLFRVCEPLVRLHLLNFCGSERVERLRKGGNEVFNSLNRTLDAAAHKMLGKVKFDEVFALLRWWPEARSSVMAMFPSLTMEMVRELSVDVFVDAVRLLVDRALTRKDAAKCLAELHLLLALADELKTSDLPRAVMMMSVICPAMDELPSGVDEGGLTEFAAKLRDMAWLPDLTRDLVSALPASVRREVLCVAVEQAAAEQPRDVCVNRLLGLADLSDRIGENDGIVLRSHIMVVVGWLVVRLDERTYQTHKSCLEWTLINGGVIARSRFSTSITGKTTHAIGKFAIALLGLADRFRNAIESGDLFTAALAIRDCPYPEFCNTALRRLAEAAGEKLAAAAYDGYLVPLQMAVVLAATGNAECWELATSILSTRVQTPEHQHLAVQWMLGEIEAEQSAAGAGILARVSHSLPALCGGGHSLKLDIILMMDEGRRLVAQAVVDGFLNDICLWSKAQAVSFYNALAHRVDLGAALPRLQTTVRLEPGEKARIEEVLDLEGGPLTDFKAIAGMGLDLSDGQVRHVVPWARGWRLMWVMLHASDAFLSDPMLLMGAKAIDAAAGDGLSGGVDEQLHRLKFPWAQEALDAMLRLQVNGTPLLSNDDLHNVLRAMMSDEQLGRDTFIWMGQVDDPDRRAALHAAAAHALISLADDSSACRFYPERPANHVVGEMVRMFEFRVMRLLKIGQAVEDEMRVKGWGDISSMLPPSRTGF
jgi:hypothetical protein